MTTSNSSRMIGIPVQRIGDDQAGDRPARVLARPDPAQWSDAELMTLGEAVALFWPDGPLTLTSVRTAVRDGDLEIARIAGKFFTTKAAIGRMATPRLQTRAEPPAAEPAPPAPADAAVHSHHGVLARIAERRSRART